MDIKPCKYCGSPAHIQTDELGATYRLICPECKENNCTQDLLSSGNLGTLDATTRKRLIEEWNDQN